MHDRKSLQDHSADIVESSEYTIKEMARAGNFGVVGAFSVAGLTLFGALASSVVQIDQMTGIAGQILWG